jgi:hypothetical protein
MLVEWRWFAGVGVSFTLISCGVAKDNLSSDSDDQFNASEKFDLAEGSVLAASDPLNKSIVRVEQLSTAIKCSGTLIAKNWVLTAGHCVSIARSDKKPENIVPAAQLKVICNEKSCPGVAQVIRHPNYKAKFKGALEFNDNIALIRLSKSISSAIPVHISDVSTEQLERKPYTEFVSVNGSEPFIDLAGYGRSSEGNPRSAGILRQGRGAYKGIVQYYGSKLIEGRASETNSAWLLTGDEGSAVFFPRERNDGRLIVAGVTSFAPTNSALRDFYAEPAGEHKGWIQRFVPAAQFTAPKVLPPPSTMPDNICQLRAYGNYDATSISNGKRTYYLSKEKGLNNTTKVDLPTNSEGFAIIRVPKDNALNLRDSCYCFRDVKSSDPSDPSSIQFPVATHVFSCMTEPPSCSISVSSGLLGGRIPQKGGSLPFFVSTRESFSKIEITQPLGASISQNPDERSGVVSVPENTSSSIIERSLQATVNDPSTGLKGSCSINLPQRGK